MKIRIISALVVLAIFIPLFIIGGNSFNIAIYILSILAMKEFIDVKSTKKEVPIFIKFICYIMMTLLVLTNTSTTEIVFGADYRIIAGLFLSLLIPTVLYHDVKKYSPVDAFYFIGGIFFLGTSFSLIILLRNQGIHLLLYLFLITIITDTYALITGLLIGKNKLLETISPKKTWEGLFGGTIMGTFISTVFYHNVIDPHLSIWIIIIISLFLSIIGQFGDLAFSAIKRYFGKKDFSNIMPGHGGVLDRLDSIIFVLLGFMFIMNAII